MTIAGTLGAPLHQDSGDPAAAPGSYEAVVTAVGGGFVSIVVPGYSDQHDFDHVAFMAPGGTPVVGDACVATFTDGRVPFVFVPGIGGPWTLGLLEDVFDERTIGDLELDFATVEALEARRR